MIALTSFELTGSIEDKKPMEKYMKNRYPFLGIRAPERRKQSKKLIMDSKYYSLNELFNIIDYLYGKNEREYHYVAIDICEANINRLSWEELVKYSDFIQMKSWWDTVDAWRKVYGLYLNHSPKEREKIFYFFYQHQNIWMRRVCITLQLMEKEKTDTDLLKKAILEDINTDEFFIQKAIGWSLRQYSKIDSSWVIKLTEEEPFLTFAKSEALKLINKPKI